MIFFCLFAVGSLSWLGLILAELGVFSIPSLLLSFALMSILFIRSLKMDIREIRRSFSPSKNDYIFLALIGVCIVIYFRPHEYIGGRWDPGTYMNTGFHIAHQGKIDIEDPIFRQMSPAEMQLFAQLKPGAVRYPGFYLKEAHVGTLVPQFYYLFPVWIALFFKLFGSYGSLFVNPFFALLSLWTLRRFIEELFDSETALVSCFLFGLSIPQIWNARFPTSEILTQYFILSGLYAYYRFEKNSDTAMGYMSGMSFALAMLARPTAILILPALTLYLVCRNWVRFSKKDLIPLSVIGLGLIHLYFQSQFWTKYYVKSLPAFFTSEEKLYYSMAGGILIFFCILTAIFRGKFQKLFEKPQVKRFLEFLLPGFLWSLALYAYWIRPQLGTSQELPNMQCLSWFLGQPWTWMAALGIAFWAHKNLKKENLLFFLLALLELIFFLYKKRTFSSYPWTLKRFTPIAVPGLAVFGAYFITQIVNKSRAKKAAVLLLCSLAVVWPLKKGFSSFVTVTDNKGLVQFMSKLNDRMDPSGIYIFDRDWLGVPFKHLFQKQVLVLPESDKFPKLEDMFLEWLKNGKKLYYIGFYEHPFAEKLNFHLLKLRLPKLNTQALESSFGSYPERIKPVKVSPKIYELQNLEETLMSSGSKVRINIGQNGIGLLGGFDKPRRFKDGTAFYRWTQASAKIEFKEPLQIRKFILNLKLKNPKPETTGKNHVRLFINDKAVKELAIDPSNHFEKYSIPVNWTYAGPIRTLSIKSDIWNPRKEGFSGDSRDLGIVLDHIQITDFQKNILKTIDIGNEQGLKIYGFNKPEQNAEAFFKGRWTTGKARLVIPMPKSTGQKVNLSIRLAGCQTKTEIRTRENIVKHHAKEGKEEPQKDQTAEKTPWLSLLINDQPVVEKTAIPEKLDILQFSFPSSLFKGKKHCVLTLESNAWKPSDYGIKGFPFKLGVLIDWIEIDSGNTEPSEKLS